MAVVSIASSTGNAYIDGLLSGEKWASSALSFGFPTSSTMYEATYGLSEPSKNFQSFNAAEQAAVRTVLAGYSAILKVSFSEANGAAAAAADLRYGESDKVATAWAYTPTSSAEGGDVWISASSALFDAPVKGGYAFMTFIHETGHTLGLKHAHEAEGGNGALPADHDSLEYTVMSYRSYKGEAIDRGYVNGTWDYPQTLMLDDIRALQTMYGANFSKAGTQVVYAWSPTTGEMSINGVGQGAPGGDKIFMTVWTGGALATYDFSKYATDLKVDLQPGHWSTVSDDQLAHLDARADNTHIAVGNIANAYYVADGANDNLVRNVLGGSGNDSILGNDADNRIQGGAGADKIDGGLGANTAVYSGRLADYSWKAAGSSWTITDLRDGSPDGTDTLSNIASLQFSDQTVAITWQAPAVSTAGQGAQNIPQAPAVTSGPTDPSTTQGPAQGEVQHSQALSDAALQSIIKAAEGTTSVGNLTYQFFTGHTPTDANLDAMVASTSNPASLGSEHFQALSLENRYIEFAVNLGTTGEGRGYFEAHFGGMNMWATIGEAYKTIFGVDPGYQKSVAILEEVISGGPDPMTREGYFTALGGSDLGAKAALIGWLLGEAAKAHTGLYAQVNDAYLVDLSDGAPHGVDLVGVYSHAFVGV